MRWGRPALLPLSAVMRVETDEKVVSLTYDDGPDPEQTPAVLDALAEAGATATFFVLSERAQAFPHVLRRMVEEGHEVALHGIDHAALTDVSAREAVRRIGAARAVVEEIIERPIRYYRPTYGRLSVSAHLGVRLLGLDVVIWTAWARDWFDAPPQEVADRVITSLHPGAVVLLHDTTDDRQALEAGPVPTFARADVTRRVLRGLTDAGYRSIRTGELLQRYRPVRAVKVQRPALPGRSR
jgi:peptidoglycan/xylan/chitin deacetylase (PgdA/CDA1 family)